MKTLEDLKRLREQVQSRTSLRNTTGTQILSAWGPAGLLPEPEK